MSSTIDIIAILSPKAGKTDRVVELLNEVAVYVKQNEPGTLKYEITRQISTNTGNEEVIMIESYKDKEALGAHGQSAAFKEFQKKLKGEGLMGGPMQLKFVKSAGGFTSRL